MKRPILAIWTVFLFLILSCGSGEQGFLPGHVIRFGQPPQRIPSTSSVDAPLLGNGYMGVALSGTPGRLTFHLNRNDFWRLVSAHNEAFPAIAGRLELTVPALEGASYLVEQHLGDATTQGRFSKEGQSLALEAFVAATEDILVLRITNEGGDRLTGRAALALPEPSAFPEKRDQGVTPEGVRYVYRAFADSVEIPAASACALWVPGSPDGSFSLAPGESLTMACATAGSFKADDCLPAACRLAAACDARHLSAALKAHRNWWAAYWNRSWVRIPDPVIEKQYYLSLYGMASCSRDPDFPPSLFGNWITKEMPAWMGDYHLNYNHMAPYYGLYSSNRLEQADPYYAPLLAAIPRGQYYSERVCGIPDGILLPVGIGPLGVETTRWSASLEKEHPRWRELGYIEDEGMFWGQKSNSAYAVCNLAMQFYRTLDKDFTERVYPFVKGVATFWEKYLVLEGDRYVILNDAIHEGTIGTKNPICSLGLVRMVMETACDMSELLGVDAGRREAWKDRHDRLADYPLQERGGKTVFRYTEGGVDWWGDNTLGIQHIFPAGQIGLASDPALLETARNTIGEMHRWMDFNGTNSFYPAAVRVGFPADSILLHLHAYALHTYPNGFQKDNPHGPENWSTVPCTVNEMLCMGHQGIVRLFPVWPVSLDAAFHQLRVEGAFLVSATLQGGEIGNVSLLSERGTPLSMQNPWPGKVVEVTASGGRKQLVEGPVLHLETSPGSTYRFRPERASETRINETY